MQKAGVRLFATLCAVALVFSCAGHARKSAPVTLPDASLQPAPGHPVSPVDSDSDSPLPNVLALDGILAGAGKSTRNGAQIVSLGADIAEAEGNYDTSGTSLNLRAIEPDAYSYAIYGQEVGEELKPISTLVDTEPSNLGGGRDDEVPLAYLMGVADYSVGSWRWFGPFTNVDVSVQVHSAALKSRFKSPSDRFYLVVLAVNGSKAASALPAEGFIADWPIPEASRMASAEEDDPGGVRVEQVVTDAAPGDEVPTEPAIVTGLAAEADASGVTLTWDKNLDPDVDIYQVGREDPDVAGSFELLTGVLAPTVTYTDTTGVPGKDYRYMVRARNPVGYGGWSVVRGARLTPSELLLSLHTPAESGSGTEVDPFVVLPSADYELRVVDDSDPPNDVTDQVAFTVYPPFFASVSEGMMTVMDFPFGGDFSVVAELLGSDSNTLYFWNPNFYEE